MTVCINFDMRAPDFGAPSSVLYKAALEMIEYADANGIDQVIFPEHHGSEDGYNPVPALMAAAAAARTKQIALVLGAIILPLHDPIHVAETIAVTDLISGGRVHAVLAAGYVEQEFKMFGKSLHDRARLMDHGLKIITRALAGERFRDGDREIFVRPLSDGIFSRLYVGGGVAASATRAAKFGLGFWGLNDDVIPFYEQECRRLGKKVGPTMRTAVGIHIAEDPDAAWEEIGPHVLHLVRSYASWGSDAKASSSPFHGLDTVEKIRAAGLVRVATPDEAVELAKTRTISLTPLISGLPPEKGWQSLELFVEKALPRIKGLK